MSTVNDLLADYLKKEEEMEAALRALREAAISEYKFKVGDVIKQGKKIGRVTGIRFDVSYYGEKPEVDLMAVAFPIKKDGTTAKVGEMRDWQSFGDPFVLVERPKP